jgi:hypothetical protein
MVPVANDSSPSGYCPHFILAEIARELTKIHPIKLEPSPTPPKIHLNQHRRFGSNYGASTIHWQRQTIPHHQAIAPISIFAEIAQELAKTHPIKLKPSTTPPNIHINQTSTFRKRLQWRHHPLTMPNDPSPVGYCQHSNYQEICLRTCEDTPNQAQAFPHTSQNSPRLNITVLEAITAPQPPPKDTQGLSQPGYWYWQHTNLCGNCLRSH